MTRPPAIRAWRQSLLWLLRSLYLARMGLCYFVMIRGRHAAPDLVHATFSVALFVNMSLFLVVFFEYFSLGRRLALWECRLRPTALGGVIAGAIVLLDAPQAALGLARGWVGPGLLGVENVLLPLATLALVRAIGRGVRS